MESGYPPIVEKILKDKPLKKKEYFGLIMTMCDFNLRNVAYENRTELERFQLYEGISKCFNKIMFEEADGQGNALKAMLDHLEENWRIASINSETGEKFITSDHPSIVFTEPDVQRPILIYLPIHPKIAVLAYDKRSIAIINDKITDESLGILNGLQIMHCVEHVFSDHCFKKDQKNWVRLQGHIEKEKPIRWIDETNWSTGFVSIASPFIDQLPFIKKL